VILKRFQNDQQTIRIAGTTALGVGIDVPYIRFAIYLFPIYSLINFDQEVGRIRRDGRTSTSYLFVNQNRNVYKSRTVRGPPLSLPHVQD
jgi:superfamily II DNA helicase RecQ